MTPRVHGTIGGLTIFLALTSALAGAPRSPKKVLVVTTTLGFRHSSIPTAEKVLGELAAKSGLFQVDYVRQPPDAPQSPRRPKDPTPAQEEEFRAAEEKHRAAEAAWKEEMQKALRKLAPASLKDYDAVIFANTTGDLPLPDRDGFLEWMRSGKAFIGMHSASDTFHGWPPFIEMLGGEFQTHGAQVGVDCINRDPKHPATAHLGSAWPIKVEEIYLIKSYDQAKVHELLVLDRHPNEKTPGHFPVSWCRDYGRGRVFYTSLGHREDV